MSLTGEAIFCQQLAEGAKLSCERLVEQFGGRTGCQTLPVGFYSENSGAALRSLDQEIAAPVQITLYLCIGNHHADERVATDQCCQPVAQMVLQQLSGLWIVLGETQTQIHAGEAGGLDLCEIDDALSWEGIYRGAIFRVLGERYRRVIFFSNAWLRLTRASVAA